MHRQPETSQPGFGRLDMKPLTSSELNRRRFSLSVESVFYYNTQNGGVRCAVLLNAHFDLRQGDLLCACLVQSDFLGNLSQSHMLALATVPLSALPSPPTGEAIEQSLDTAEINIAGRYPTITQWVEVKRQTGTKDVLVTPNIQFNAGAGGGGISGVGVDRHQSDNRSYKISLDSKQEAFVGQPVSLSWLVLHRTHLVSDIDQTPGYSKTPTVTACSTHRA